MSTPAQDPSYTVIYIARETGDLPIVSYAFFKTEEKAQAFYASRTRPVAIRAYNPLSDYTHRGDIPEVAAPLQRGPSAPSVTAKAS